MLGLSRGFTTKSCGEKFHEHLFDITADSGLIVEGGGVLGGASCRGAGRFPARPEPVEGRGGWGSVPQRGAHRQHLRPRVILLGGDNYVVCVTEIPARSKVRTGPGAGDG